jgi:hypothetical protein
VNSFLSEQTSNNSSADELYTSLKHSNEDWNLEFSVGAGTRWKSSKFRQLSKVRCTEAARLETLDNVKFSFLSIILEKVSAWKLFRG